MVICRIVQLLEAFKTTRQVGSYGRRIVPAKRALIKVEVVLIIVREVGNLLKKGQKYDLAY